MVRNFWVKWGDSMLLFLGILGLVLSIIFFLVDKFDEHSAIISSLSRNNGYKKLQTFLLVMFFVLTPLGLYFMYFEKQTFVHFEHVDHYHFVNGKIGTVAILEDNLIKQNVAFDTKLVLWNNIDSENLVILAKHKDGYEKEFKEEWMLDTSEEALSLKNQMDASAILHSSFIFERAGDWKLTFYEDGEKLGSVDIEVK
jgi:hypothetical protein